LYHEEEVTLYDPQDVEFKCTCSRERCAGALKTLPDEELTASLPKRARSICIAITAVITICSTPWISLRSVTTPRLPTRRFTKTFLNRQQKRHLNGGAFA
jgi:hypothetical protein